MNWADFWHMGGYGFYVWSSWGLTIIIMLLLVITASFRRKRIINELTTKAQRAKIKAEQENE